MVNDDLKLEALGKLMQKRRREREDVRVQNRLNDNSQNLAKGSLDKDVMKVKRLPVSPEMGNTGLSNMKDKNIIKNATEKINTNDVTRVGKIDSWADKIEALRKNKTVQSIGDGLDSAMDFAESKKGILKKIAGKGLKSVPLLGGIYSAIESGDVSAAIPVLGDAEGTGPQKDTIGYREEHGLLTEEDKMQILKERQKIMNNQP